MRKSCLGMLRIALIAAIATVGTASQFVYAAAAAPPTITGYNWSPAPKSNQPFGGYISGTSFISGTRVIFCKTGTSTCYTQSPANISFAGATRLNLKNVKLAAGSWQVNVQTPEGTSAKSRPFNVSSALPTITGHNWTPSPKSNQPFRGHILGTDFVSGTRVIFCKTGTSTCYTQSPANVSFAGATRLNLPSIKLAAGSWQVNVQTPEGTSAKSRPFNVASSLPTITGYNWTSSPKSNQPFRGNILGTDFVSSTRVIFCKTGTNTCYTQSPANVSFAGATQLNVSKIKLAAGSWQFHVLTPEGQSQRSRSFTVAP